MAPAKAAGSNSHRIYPALKWALKGNDEWEIREKYLK